jgi:hypothetical protein
MRICIYEKVFQQLVTLSAGKLCIGAHVNELLDKKQCFYIYDRNIPETILNQPNMQNSFHHQETWLETQIRRGF